MRRRVAAVLLLLSSPACLGAEVVVAVASNFSEPLRDIAAEFARSGGDRLAMVVGSTGKLATQIENGAPFEVFLAADQDTPRRLVRRGLALPGSTYTYATGRLVLWSAKPDVDLRQGAILQDGSWSTLAIAEPRLAPYGAAAEQVLRRLGVWAQVQPRLVRGENIGRTWQFVASGNADLGLVARSQVMRDGRWLSGSAWLVPSDWHLPLRQDAVLLQRAAGSAAARRLMAYLGSPQVRRIVARHGYE